MSDPANDIGLGMEEIKLSRRGEEATIRVHPWVSGGGVGREEEESEGMTRHGLWKQRHDTENMAIAEAVFWMFKTHNSEILGVRDSALQSEHRAAQPTWVSGLAAVICRCKNPRCVACVDGVYFIDQTLARYIRLNPGTVLATLCFFLIMCILLLATIAEII